MGNTLVGIAPSQIFPVEHYLTDQDKLQYEQSLGSTRFLKVARAQSQDGPIVVKVFAIHDPTLPLSPYKDRLEEIRELLAPAVNCLPFQNIVVTDKAGLIMREYVKFSLYDRISTRPFLTTIEKKWITFQILYALHQCHKVGVCHGDIKLENITITSWNWVLLVDFASFKPTFLPEDNPADYSYFFDTSRRRSCYIAPERFMKTLTSDSNTSMFNETPHNSGELKPAMDIFSAGCALLELWNEGHPPFDLSQLLAYRLGEYSVKKHLDNIKDPSLRSLLASMVQKDPNDRLSAEIYLAQERGKIFPEYFYTFLQSYMLIFSSSPIIPPDEKVARLYKDIGNIINILSPNDTTNSDNDKEDEEKKDLESSDYSFGDSFAENGLVIITSLVTSCIRGLHHCTSRMQCLDILLQLAAHVNEETILDRILPYILYLSQSNYDNSPRVKVAAIHTLTQCLNLVKHIPRSDANIFPEYILPGLAPCASDPNVSVRVAYAHNIATLAEIALRYLEQSQSDLSSGQGKTKEVTLHGKDAPKINYEIELQTLHEMVQQTVSALLTDSQTIVKQTLMESGITKLCIFFGKQKANDVLLSHMITFLNDKEDKELRGSFFDCIIGVAAYVGWQSSTILSPLLLQGLTDSSEFVTTKCINAMSALTELGLLQKTALCELISETSCYLVHPGLWIRQAVAGFISTAARTLSLLDVQCKVMPHINMFLKYQLIQIDRPELLLECLVAPIPRIIYDSVIKYSDIHLLLKTLNERKEARQAINTGRIPQYSEMPSALKNLFRRLSSEGMTDCVEDHLLLMANHLKKIHKYKTSADAKHNKQSDGRIEINSKISNVKYFEDSLSGPHTKTELLQMTQNRKIKNRTNNLNIASTELNMNSEWQHMFSAEVISGGNLENTDNSSPTPPNDNQSSITVTDPMANMSLHERSYIQCLVAHCRVAVRSLIARQQEHYIEALRSREWAEQAAWQPPLPPPGWRLRGSLVAHLHEHRSAVTKLAPISDTSMFASSSMDGCVRLWDCHKMEGKNIANRSKQFYKAPNNNGLTSLTVCDAGQSLATATMDGSILVLRMDPSSSKMSLLQTKQIDIDEDGTAIDVQYLDAGSQSVLVYSTLYGSIIGWDMRAPGIAWRLQNDLKQGVITSFCMDSQHSWLTLGTSSGYHVAWDLRFQLPIATIVHPTGARIRKVISHPTEHSWVISAVQGNNEISMWNLETGFRQCVLWASPTPALSNTQVSNYSVGAMYAGCIDRSGFLLAGGSDQRLRFWDLESPCSSYLAIPSPNDTTYLNSLKRYENRLIDGTRVILERSENQPNRSTPKADQEVPRAGPEPAPPGHRDWISDITLCKASQCFLLTASRDGVIKLWK